MGRLVYEPTWSPFNTSHNSKNESNLKEWLMIWIMSEPTELHLMIFRRINLDSQNPNTFHQEPNRRHSDHWKFHTWWMESSFVFVQHLPFSVLSIVLKRYRKEREKNSCEKRVSAKSKQMMNLFSRCSEKEFCRTTSYCIRKPRENQTRKTKFSKCASWDVR